jgi:hypothetical protein
MNRKEFAQSVAGAYFRQYVLDDEFDKVMNNPVIDYSLEDDRFCSCSSLTLKLDSEVRVLELEDGMFGEVDTEENLIAYLVDNDELWNEVVEKIKSANDQEKA